MKHLKIDHRNRASTSAAYTGATTSAVTLTLTWDPAALTLCFSEAALTGPHQALTALWNSGICQCFQTLCSMTELCLEELGNPLRREDVLGTLTCCVGVLCALTRLLCRGWARLHWHECTEGIPSTRASPVQTPLGYNSPHQDLLWLLYMHFSSQHSSFLMTSCPWSSTLRMCKKLECNQNRTLTQGNT